MDLRNALGTDFFLFSFGATALILAYAYLHEALRGTELQRSILIKDRLILKQLILFPPRQLKHVSNNRFRQ